MIRASEQIKMVRNPESGVFNLLKDEVSGCSEEDTNRRSDDSQWRWSKISPWQEQMYLSNKVNIGV